MNRLFEILLILLEKDKMTATALAEHFEVSKRTILRDIDKLLVAGIPIIAQPGYNGGISIDENYQLNIKLMSKEERESILDGLHAIDSIRSSPILTKFISKLLGDTNQVSYMEVIDIDLASWYGTTLIQKIESIKISIQDQTKITFLYYSNKGEIHKKVSPIKIMFRWSSWYLVGICDEVKDARFYKLNRIDQLTQTNESYEKQLIHYHHEDYFDKVNYKLVAIFDFDMKYRLIDEYGVNCFIEKEDKLHFERDFVSKEYMISWILSFGNKVIIKEPLEIKEEIKEIVKKMNEIYEVDI